MSYTYTDRHGDELNILQHPDKVRVGSPSRLVDIKPEDAPAVALAILEAAGMADDPWSETCAAVKALRRHEKVRAEKAAEQAEREAEDAKVREFMAALPGASYTGADHELCRNLYRAAREFFGGTQ